MNKKMHSYNEKKGMLFLLISFVILIASVLSANQIANASSLLFGRRPTLTNQERKLKEIEEVKERIKEEANPTSQAALLRQLKSAEIDATTEAISETLMPTLNVIASTENAISTEKAKNDKGGKAPRLATPFGASTVYSEVAKRTETPYSERAPHNLLPGESGLTIPFPLPNQKKEHEFTTVWVERVDELHATLFYAGGIKGTDQGIIYWSDELAHTDNVFIVGGTGELSISERQGNFLVLKTKSNDELYFDILTKQYTTSTTEIITPITTIMPTQTPLPSWTPATQGTPAYPAP